MSMATREDLYRWHVANTRSIEIAMRAAARSCRQAIAAENKPARQSFLSLYALLLGAWAENRLQKLLHESAGLSDDEREDVGAQSSQFESWRKVTEIGYRRFYGVPRAALSDETLPFSVFAQYSKLTEMLGTDLRSVIEMRNKLAHGQWVYPLNGQKTEIDQDRCKDLRRENLLAVQFKRTMIAGLADIVQDLVISPMAYVRDFDARYRQIAQARCNLRTRDYSDYARQLVGRRQRGIRRRRREVG